MFNKKLYPFSWIILWTFIRESSDCCYNVYELWSYYSCCRIILELGTIYSTIFWHHFFCILHQVFLSCSFSVMQAAPVILTNLSAITMQSKCQYTKPSCGNTSFSATGWAHSLIYFVALYCFDSFESFSLKTWATGRNSLLGGDMVRFQLGALTKFDHITSDAMVWNPCCANVAMCHVFRIIVDFARNKLCLSLFLWRFFLSFAFPHNMHSFEVMLKY